MAGTDPIGPSTDYSDPSSPAGPPGGPVPANPLWHQAMDQAGLSQAASPPATPASASGQNGTAGGGAAFVAPASPAAGGVLAWAARNGAALAGAGAAGLAGAILLTPTNSQRRSTELGVDGHPDLGARMDTAPGSRSGTVTLYPRGQDGQPASPGLKLAMDPDGQLTGPRGTPYDGMAFGAVVQDGSGTVQLAPGARDALAPAPSGTSTTPQAAASDRSPPDKPQIGTAYETRTQQEANLAASLQAQGKSGQDIQTGLDEARNNAGVGATARVSPRDQPGTATMSKPLPDVTGPWLRGTEGNAGLIPGQVAAKLEGQQFNNFGEFRSAMWKEVANTPELAEQFSESNITLMQRGSSPFVQKEQKHGDSQRYILHHRDPISNGGGVYDMSNIAVVTPKFHQTVLDPKTHFGGGTQ